VLEKEPPESDNPLLKLDNVVFTPYSAFYFEESYVELKRKVAETVLSVLKRGGDYLKQLLIHKC
jgi:D-3-phosphoglycerate dehydrogenase